jgi:hypothetical protein
MIAGHPHTVRSSHVPLYMQGIAERLSGLGQDEGGADPMPVPIDTTSYEGGDLVFPSDFGAPNPVLLIPSGSDLNLDPSTFEPTGGLVNTVPTLTNNQRDIANLYAQAVASGTMTPAQAHSAAAAQITQAAATVAKAAGGSGVNLGPGPSPRVGVPAVPGSAASLFTQQSIPGIPNWALLALLGVGALAMGRR